MNCPLCACAQASTFMEESTFTVLECASCGFRFIDTSAPNYPADAQYAFDQAEIGVIRPQWPHIQRRVKDVLRLKRPPGLALDVGCGKGEVALALSEKGFRCTGMDMKQGLISHLRTGFPQVEWTSASMSDLAGQGRRFDLVTMYHVLEHIPDPGAALAAARSLANPGALIVIEVPNVGGWEARLKGRKWHYYKADHVSYFRLRDLTRLAAEARLEVVAIRGYQHFSYPQGVIWKDWIKGALGWLGFKDVISVFLVLR